MNAKSVAKNLSPIFICGRTNFATQEFVILLARRAANRLPLGQNFGHTCGFTATKRRFSVMCVARIFGTKAKYPLICGLILVINRINVNYVQNALHV